MDDIFTKKERAASVAGWWTLLIVGLVGLIQWLAYLYISANRPEWMLLLWGEGVTWPTVIGIWFRMMAAFKIIAWTLAIVVIWLTLWARRLSRMS